MKALILALSLLPLTTFARNLGNDGPSGMPQPPSMPATVIAEVVSACGFMCPNGDFRGVRILADGSVIRYSAARNVPEKDTLLARLDRAVAAKLQAQIEGMEISELVDQDEGKPQCMDAGTTTYLVHKAGKAEKIAQNMGCHSHVMSNGAGRSIQTLLEGFESLPL